ncbi:tripartite tricarboxylate transporter substrate binding protein [Candidimonas humi]|jgi:tripartite-type tricarboxylate transporter receptor subunit TctC|uniref:Bug family tripartite tricarboxylate transporter substrate binding protein n=1 Tax=Candidimonas humi TaxID=683355 RepID=A0ABV8NX67_9BURK|nr:tripartite tricarboxylate transporter substrate binding protein [Candidimonas humi]MBV6303946.1 tripartite tricarboxylate transporter substrate binding protein [Candidimonas humi]
MPARKIKAAALYASIAGLLAATAPLGAQAAGKYPDHPVTIVVPFGAGGSADVYARQLAQRLQQKFGQNFIVEDKPGAGAVIGTAFVANSPPDGYTLLINSNTQTVNETLLKKKPYKLLRDFAPVAPINQSSLVLVANDKLPAHTLKELIALAKSEPGKLNYASSGTGTPYHIAGELFKSMAGINVVHVPYKSSGQARTGVVAGEVNYMFDATATMIGLIKGGKVHAIATTGDKRSSILPDVPTMEQAGLPGYRANIWLGVLAPKKTPAAVVEKLNKAISEIVSSPDIKAAWAKDGVEPMVMNTSQFKEYIEADIRKLGKVVKDAHISVQ